MIFSMYSIDATMIASTVATCRPDVKRPTAVFHPVAPPPPMGFKKVSGTAVRSTLRAAGGNGAWHLFEPVA